MKSLLLRLARRALEAREFLLRKGNTKSIVYKKPLFREGILSLQGVTYVTQTRAADRNFLCVSASLSRLCVILHLTEDLWTMKK